MTFRFCPFLLPFCVTFSNQSLLPTPLLWLTFLTGYAQMPSYSLPALFSPIFILHTPWRNPVWRHRGKDRASQWAGLWDRLRCPFWTAGVYLYIAPSPPKQLPSVIHSPCVPPPLPFAPAAGAVIPLFFSSPGNSGPQLFDQVMVPFSPTGLPLQSQHSLVWSAAAGEMKFSFSFLFHKRGILPC